MALTAGDFIVSVEFGDDSGKIDLGADGEIFVSPAEGNKSVQLDDAKLNLIRLLQDASKEAVTD